MKIAWFTPFSQKSAIGEYSRRVTNELAARCEVHIWVDDDSNIRQTNLPVITHQKNSEMLQRLSHYDIAVYNMGDSLHFHKTIYEMSRVHRGVIVLHDLVLHHFFADYYLSLKNEVSTYLWKMEELYGKRARRAAELSIKGKDTGIWRRDEDVMMYPFFEEALINAEGVLVHSQRDVERVREKWYGPVAKVFNPCAEANQSATPPCPISSKGATAEPLWLVSIGHVNPNKKIDKVIEVIGRSRDLAENTRYVVIGPYEGNVQYAATLKGIIEKFSLEGRVRLLGYQSDEIRDEFLRKADMFINLRFPSMASNSWSLMEQLLTGKPVVVFDEGFFAELPDDCVFKVPAGDYEGLRTAILSLTRDESRRLSIGSRGKAYATQFTAARYADEFLDFVERVREWRPALEISDRVGKELALMGVNRRMATVKSVAAQLSRFLPES